VCLVHFAMQRSMGMVAAAAVAGLVLLIAESYFVFGLKDVWTEFEKKWRESARPA
jgi:hypothetical protein